MNNCVPLIYALRPNKEEGTHERFFREVKTLAPAAQQRNVLADFELAAMNALPTVFQTPNNDLTLSGCCFHLNQNIGKRVQIEGLKARYEGDPAFAFLLRHSCFGICTCYTTPEQTLPNEMLPILDYFERTYPPDGESELIVEHLLVPLSCGMYTKK